MNYSILPTFTIHLFQRPVSHGYCCYACCYAQQDLTSSSLTRACQPGFYRYPKGNHVQFLEQQFVNIRENQTEWNATCISASQTTMKLNACCSICQTNKLKNVLADNWLYINAYHLPLALAQVFSYSANGHTNDKCVCCQPCRALCLNVSTKLVSSNFLNLIIA